MPEKIKCPKCVREMDKRGLKFHLMEKHDLRKTEAESLLKTFPARLKPECGQKPTYKRCVACGMSCEGKNCLGQVLTDDSAAPSRARARVNVVKPEPHQEGKKNERANPDPGKPEVRAKPKRKFWQGWL